MHCMTAVSLEMSDEPKKVHIITFFIVDALNINFIDYLCEQKQNNSELE